MSPDDLLQVVKEKSVPTDSGCRVWTGRTSKKGGYALISFGGVDYRVHRLIYSLLVRPLTGPSEVVRHKCDNPPCVEVSHLIPGSLGDNIADRVSRGRCAHGESHGNSKLTKEDVIEIRRLRESGVKLADISARFGISLMNVSYIARRKSWVRI